MALYRRTISTLSGPGQSIPDYGAQEALAAKSLQAQIAKSKQAQRNFMQEASFKRRKYAADRMDRKEAIGKAEAMAEEQRAYEREVLERQEGYKEEERGEKRKAAEHRRKIELLAKARQSKPNDIPLTPEMRAKFPGLPAGVPLPAFLGLSKKVEGDKDALIEVENKVKEQIAGFIEKKLISITDDPGTDIVWEDSDFLKLNMVVTGLKSKFEKYPEVDVPGLVRGELDRQMTQYNEAIIKPKLQKNLQLKDWRTYDWPGAHARSPQRTEITNEAWRMHHTMELQQQLYKAPNQLRKHIEDLLKAQYP